MMYIDPKDQPPHPDWPDHFKKVWELRRKKRLDQLAITKQIESYDVVIEVLIKLDAKAGDTPKAGTE
jgi:hypothetical protein